jgi:Tol biopolymer transport system component
MSLPERAHIGPYEIVGWLGAGGMGEVYGARDSRLGRQVAIKLISDTFAADSSRVRRFEQEARAAGQLNHPNVLAVYDVGIHAGAPYIVSELLEGESLRSRLQVADLPWRKAVDYARQTAEGLAAAHDKGIVHLDIKPDNLFVTNDGRIKILDFGIAKLTHAGDDLVGDADETDTAKVTVMGTAGYMSPEQIRGEPLDARSDIFSMGSILYEMLAGHPAFVRETAADTMAAILKEEPQRLSTDAPPALERIVSRCLEKSREARFQSARDLAFSLDVLSGARTATSMAAAAPLAPADQWQVVRWLATLSIVAVVGMAGLVFRRPPAAEAPEMRFQIAMTPATYPVSVAISPDGRRAVSSATAESGAQLSLRALESEITRLLPGTEDAQYPFWSPDNRSIGFFANGQLKRVDIDSGVVQTVASVPNPRGGAWSSEGTILFGIASGPLYRVPARGGTAIPATHLLPDQTGHRFPHFLPDGHRFLVFAIGTPARQGIYVGSLNQTDAQRLPIDAESEAEFLPPGHVAFVRHGALWAERVDFERMQAIGEPALVARQVLIDADTAAKAAFATSEAGSVVYRATDDERQLSWLDRSGHEVGVVGGTVSGQQADIRLSSDGRTVALLRTVDGNRDVWLVDTTARGFPRRLTFDPAIEELPFLSRDGSRVVFTSTRTRGVADLYERSVNGDANDRLLLESLEQKNSQDLSPDGHYLLYSNQTKETGFDLWVLPLFGDRKPEVVVRTSYNENRARFSPDGGWIAYQSNETGQNEIYIHPFHRPGDAVQVSSGGGSDATWSHDGRELFYIGRNNHLMAVPVRPRGPTIEAGTPVSLFSLSRGSEYAPSPDGRFLINRSVRDSSPLTILLNWKGPKQ